MTPSTDPVKRLRENSPPYPPLYTPFKVISSRLAVALRDSRTSSNVVTVVWAMLLTTASVALAYRHLLFALALILLAIMLDCLDGDLARCRNRPSISGTLLEQIAHWIGNMGLMAGAGAAVLLTDPRPANVLLVSTLVVAQSVYIAVVRQVRSDSANIAEYPRLRQTFRWIIKALWIISPIELPLIATFLAFGTTPQVLLVITVVLIVLSAVVFIPHFVLIHASDRRQWTTAEPDSISYQSRPAAQTFLGRLPDARYWTPGTPKLPTDVLSLLSRQPMAAGAPVLGSVWRELTELLPLLFRTSGRALPLACPDEVAVEAVISTFCRAGDEILVAGNQSTIRRWRSIAERIGVQVVPVERPFGEPLRRTALESALAGHPIPKAACLPLSEAEDGMLTDLPGLADALRELGCLVVVDACLSLCADDLRMDDWGVDVAVSSSASGVMAPPGLSLIALGPRALDVLGTHARDGSCSGTYLNLRTHLHNADRPLVQLPASALAGLYLSVQIINTVGIDTLLSHHRDIVERFRLGCVEAVGLSLLDTRPTAACTAARLPAGVDLLELQRGLFAVQRMVVASGSTPDGAVTVQFGHAGWLFPEDVDLAVRALAAAVDAARTGKSRGEGE